MDKKFQNINRLQLSKRYTLEGRGDSLQQVIGFVTVTYEAERHGPAPPSKIDQNIELIN